MSIISILVGIIGFGILVFVHELGHFLAAKLTGVRVEVFSIGWGNAIIKKKIKDTVYQIGFIPFGGYCKLAGEMIDDTTKNNGERHDHFYSKKPWEKLIVVSSGIVFNIIFAILLLTILGLFPSQESVSPPTIYISEELHEMPAYKAGLRTGDTIIRINNKPIANYNQIAQNIVNSMGDSITIDYARNQQKTTVLLNPIIDKNSGRAMIGIYPFIKPIVDSIDIKSPLYDDRIAKNSEIISVKLSNNEIIPTESAVQLNKIVEKYGNQFEYITIKLPDGTLFSKFFQKNISVTDLMVNYQSTTVKIPGRPFFSSFTHSFSKSYSLAVTFFKSLKVLISGKISLRNALSGPVRLVHYSSEVAKTGIANYIGFLALLSLILGLTNVLPIPGVDGSFIVFFLIEIIGRRELNKKTLMKIQQVGMTMLLILMGFVIVNDIFFLIKGSF